MTNFPTSQLTNLVDFLRQLKKQNLLLFGWHPNRYTFFSQLTHMSLGFSLRAMLPCRRARFYKGFHFSCLSIPADYTDKSKEKDKLWWTGLCGHSKVLYSLSLCIVNGVRNVKWHMEFLKGNIIKGWIWQLGKVQHDLLVVGQDEMNWCK